MTDHVLATIDHAIVDQSLADAMRWTPQLPAAPRCGVCDAVLPLKPIVEVDETTLAGEKPRADEAPDACPNWIADERHWNAP